VNDEICFLGCGVMGGDVVLGVGGFDFSFSACLVSDTGVGVSTGTGMLGTAAAQECSLLEGLDLLPKQDLKRPISVGVVRYFLVSCVVLSMTCFCATTSHGIKIEK
jgi:hypothetical protein